MQNNFLKFGLGIGLLIVMVAFQNCTVYQSSGRKYLEQEGVQLSSFDSNSAETSNKQLVKVAEDVCEQYLPSHSVDRFTGGITSIRSFAAIEDDQLNCMYSVADSKIGSDHIACEISSELLSKANFPQQGDLEIYSGSIGNIIGRETDKGFCLNISPQAGVLGASCCLNSTDGQYISAEKAKELALEVLGNLR